jgi:hypothetical protein
MPLASAAASPPLEPPAVRLGFQGAEGVYAQPHVGQIGAANRYRAGGAHAFDDRRIRWHYRLGQRRHAPGGGQTGHVDVLLYREGNAM